MIGAPLERTMAAVIVLLGEASKGRTETGGKKADCFLIFLVENKVNINADAGRGANWNPPNVEISGSGENKECRFVCIHLVTRGTQRHSGHQPVRYT